MLNGLKDPRVMVAVGGGLGGAMDKNSTTTAWKVLDKNLSPKEYPFPFPSFSPIILAYLSA